MINHCHLSNRGATLPEVMVAVAILSIVMSAMLALVSFSFEEQQKVAQFTTMERIIQSVAADLRSDSSVYIKNFASPMIDNTTILADANLPFLFNDDIHCDNIATPGCCPTCLGKFGYTIRPINGYPGMFMTTIRVSHPNLTNGEMWYEFIMVPK